MPLDVHLFSCATVSHVINLQCAEGCDDCDGETGACTFCNDGGVDADTGDCVVSLAMARCCAWLLCVQ